MTEKEFTREQCIEFGRRNVRLHEQNGKLRFSRMNYMALSLLGWALFIASAAGWLPQ